MIYKVNMTVMLFYKHYHLMFERSFDLPFAPFYGLDLINKSGNFTNVIKLENTDSTKTSISYFKDTDDISNDCFNVNVLNTWSTTIYYNSIDYILEKFEKTGYIRTDQTDIKELKHQMEKDGLPKLAV